MVSDAENIYLITFAPATCGKFVLSVIWCFLERPEGFATFSNHGNAHTISSHKLNWEIQYPQKDFEKNKLSNHLYNLVRPKTKEKPFITFGHKFPVFDDFFNLYPNGKLIFIQHSSEDIEYIKQLFYYKVSVDMLRLNSTIEDSGLEHLEFDLPQFNDPKVPEMYKDKTYIVKFRDILNEDSDFLETLGKFLNKEVTDGIKNMHKVYLAKQPIDLSFAKNTN